MLVCMEQRVRCSLCVVFLVHEFIVFIVLG